MIIVIVIIVIIIIITVMIIKPFLNHTLLIVTVLETPAVVRWQQ